MHARRNHLILVAIILATLVGVALIGIPSSPAHKKARLGLDLQGGLEVVLQAVPPKGQKVTQQGLDNTVSIMRSRVDKLGVAEPEIRKQGNDQIVVQLPGVKDAAQAAQLIGKTAQLEFYDLQADPFETVNLLGGVAWWATVRRGGVGTPNPRLVRAYDRWLVPTTRLVERRVRPPFGQSVLGVAAVPS